VAGASNQIVVLTTEHSVSDASRTKATFTLPTAGVASLHLRHDKKIFAAACWDSRCDHPSLSLSLVCV
jgi:hypothetical protein